MQLVIAQASITNIAAQDKKRLRLALFEAIRNYKKRMIAYLRSNPNIPIATGRLLKSGFSVINKSSVIGTSFTVYYGFDAEYAKYVDQGREPGKFPPVDAIRDWCITVGIPPEYAFAIARAIAQRGIAPKNFFKPGLQVAKRVLQEEFTSSMSKAGFNVSVNII